MATVVLDRVHLEEVVDRFTRYPAFAFDTETKGQYRLDPRRNRVFWLQMCGPGLDAVVIPFGHPRGRKIGTRKEPRLCADGKTRQYTVPVFSDPPEQLSPAEVFAALKPLFFDESILKIGHNIKFDLESTAKYWGDIPAGDYFDTQIAAFQCNENLHQYRLEAVIGREFDFHYDKTVAKNLEEYPFAVAAQYAHYDAVYTWMLYERLLPRLSQEHVRGVMRLEMDLLPALCRMEMAGIPLDVDALHALDADLDADLVRLKATLYRLAGREWNFASPKQCQEVFFAPRSKGGQGLKPKKFTAKTQQPSTDDAALDHFVGNPLIDAYKEYKDVAKLSSTYVKAYLYGGGKSGDHNNAPPYNEETGRVHGNFKQFGAVTGRLSSSEPNLQNIPRPDTERGLRVRSLFVAPPGETLIVADWSQIEYRVLAKFSNDGRLIRTFIDGVDFHTYVASLLLNKPMDEVTKVERTLSKNTNFAVIYGAGIDKIATMSGVSKSQATEFKRRHSELLPKVYRYCNDVVVTCKRQKNPHITTLLGRKRRLPEIRYADEDRRCYAERQSVNASIQGSAADLMKMAIIRLDAMLPAGFNLLLTVHDELVMSVPDERVEEGIEVMREAMTGKDIAALLAPVPLVADIHAVKNWADANA